MYIENHQINKNMSIWLISMFCILSIMITVGGLTRLTDSGLSIVEWNIFSGIFPPLFNNDWIELFEKYKQFPEFKLINKKPITPSIQEIKENPPSRSAKLRFAIKEKNIFCYGNQKEII